MGEQFTQKEVFVQCQTGLQGHGKLIKTLNRIYKKTEHGVFVSEFLHYLKYAMVVFKREPAVERMIDFVAKFLPSLVKSDKNKEKEKDDVEEEEEDDEQDIMADNKLLQETFDFLLQHHSARDRAVRFRCCQLINKLLANLGEEAQIDDELYDRLYECMLDRVKDKCPVVRYHAVLAMARLQDPSDVNCPVIKAYLFLLNCDPNADVRRAVLTSIAPSTKTLASIVGRTRDVRDTVRKVAYEVLSEKVHVKALSIALRLQLLNEGLTDRSDLVKQTCSGKLLQSWMRTFDGSILNLLKSLDVEDSTDICCTVVETLFKGSNSSDIVQDFKFLGENLLIPVEELTSESVFYWQMICKYFHKMGTDGDEYLDKVLPNCVDFCGYVKRYVEGLREVEDPEVQLGREFIIEQLLLIASYMDTADSASRKALENLLHNMASVDYVSHRLVKPLVLRICQLRGDSEGLVQYFAELISEIREPITVVEKDIAEEQKRQLNIKIASIRVKLNQYREELDESVKNQDFTKAAELKTWIAELDEEKAKLLEASEPSREEIRTERNDPLTIQKCQTIISEMLQNLKLNSVSPTLQMMIESQIVPGIQNEDADVRNMAMQALGLCCYLSKDLLVTYIPLFMQASQIDVELVRITALQIMFDLLLIYGLEVINATEGSSSPSGDEASTGEDNPESITTDEENGQSESSVGVASKLVAIISSFLDGESSDLRTSAAEGLSKLLLSGRVVSPKILSHLILLWYNPLSEDDTHLRDCLGTFFPLFALASRSNQEIVEEAFIPTLKTLLNAPTTSPLAEVDVNNVAELLVPLTNSTLLSQNQNASEISRDNPGHDNLSEKVCNEILSDPTSPHVKLWIRILNQMEVSPDNEVVLKDLRILCYKMMKTLTDKLCLKSLSKFQGTVNQLASKFVTNDDDLENIEIEPVHQEAEEEAPEETTIQTPKRKKVRGLYSQNMTLESEVMDLDISQDVTIDIDASCLMRQSSSMSNTPSRRSRKNTTEVAAEEEEDEIFLKPDPPARKSLESVEETVSENKEGSEKNEENINEPAAEEDSLEKNSKAPEKRKSDLKETTQEKRPRIRDKESPEKGRSRSKERKQKSPKKPAEKPAKEKSVSKSPQKETGKATSKSPNKANNKSPKKDTTKTGSKRSSVSPGKKSGGKDASKSPVKPPSKSPEKRSSSKRKASSSPDRRSSSSPEKRQRSADIPTKNHLKRKASPARRDSKSPEKKSRSESRDRPSRSQQQTKQTNSKQKKSSSSQQRDLNQKQAGRNVQQTRNAEASSQQKPKGPVKKVPAEKSKEVKSPGKTSPRKTRGSLANIVADTPEARSRSSLSSKGSTPSIAETPDTDSSSAVRRSVRGKNTPRSSDTPLLSARSTRSRGTPGPESSYTPKIAPQSNRIGNQTPNVESPRTSARRARSALETDVESPKGGKKTGKEPAVKGKTSSKSTSTTKSASAPKSSDESLSSSGSPDSKSTSQSDSRRSLRHAQSQEQTDSSSPTTVGRRAAGKPVRSAPSKRPDGNTTNTTTDDDEEEDQIKRRVRPFRKSTGSKSAEVKQAGTKKATTSSPGSLTRSSVREAVGHQPNVTKTGVRNTTQRATQKSTSNAAPSVTRKPSTPKSQKSDSQSDGESTLSSPGSARSTRSTRMTDAGRATRSTNVKVTENRSTTARTTTTSSQANKTAKTKPDNKPRWK